MNLNLNKIISYFISLESIFIYTMIPLEININLNDINYNLINYPITLQFIAVIILTILFSKNIVYAAFSSYILIGLFLIPVFHYGGSLGYLLTPNFGYLLGIYPLIYIVNNLNKMVKINIFIIFKICIYSLLMMHLIGIIYLTIIMMIFNNINIVPYNIGFFSLSKIPYQIMSLIPTTFIIKFTRSWNLGN